MSNRQELIDAVQRAADVAEILQDDRAKLIDILAEDRKLLLERIDAQTAALTSFQQSLCELIETMRNHWPKNEDGTDDPADFWKN